MSTAHHVPPPTIPGMTPPDEFLPAGSIDLAEQQAPLPALHVELPVVSTVKDAVDQIARVKAVTELLSEHKEACRGLLIAEAAKVTEATGAAANWPIKGVGRALMTDPEKTVVIVDEGAWHAWALANAPSRIQTRHRVVVGDHDAVAALVLEAKQHAGHPDFDSTSLLRKLADALVVDVERYVDESLLADTAAAAVIGPDGSSVLIEDVGEIIPGLEWQQRTKPNLTVTPDKKYVERLKNELRPQITAALPQVAAPADES